MRVRVPPSAHTETSSSVERSVWDREVEGSIPSSPTKYGNWESFHDKLEEVNQELVDYIREQLKAGITDPEIRKILAESGWADEDIEKAFQALKVPGLESDGSVAVTTGDASGTSKFDLGIADKAEITETKSDFDKECL